MVSVTVIGSTRFKKEIQEVQRKLSLAGYYVNGMFVFSHADNENLTTEQVEKLIQFKEHQIINSDVVYVVNPGNDVKIGELTAKEVEFAKERDKVILINGVLQV